MRAANARMNAPSPPAAHGVRTVVLAALFFAVSEMAVAAAHRILVPRTTLVILFALELGLALVVSAAGLAGIALLARILRGKADGAGRAALRTAGALLAMPLFFSFYVLNTRGLALLPLSGSERLFFNGLFVLLAAAAVAVAATSFKRAPGAARGLPFLAGCFFLQLVLPAVYFFFLSSVQNPSTATARLVFLFLMTAPLAAAAWLAARVAAGFKRPWRTSFAAGGLVLVPLLLLAFVPPYSNYRRQPSPPRSRLASKTAARPNVVFVVWDTGRKDRCSLYGHSRPTTPHLAALAADGAAFRNALTVSPWTLPSHASMFTGLYPSQHGADNTEAQRRFGRPLTPEALTLAEILRAEGYDTAALTANHGVMSTSFGLAQGFDVYFDERPHVFDLLTVHLLAKADENILRKLRINSFSLAPELNRHIFSALEKQRGAPFFLFVNYMEPHGADYLPPPARGLFGGAPRPPAVPTAAILEGRETISPAAQEALFTRYDEDLAACDAGLGQLLEQLKALGLYETSLIVVTSDHGQCLGEHQFFGHRSVLYEEVLEIPLVVKSPRGAVPRTDPARPFENRELFFLILEELGIPSPRPPLRAFQDAEGATYTMAEGVSFPLGSERALERFAGTWVSVTRHAPPRPKLFLSSAGRDELFLLDEDPREQRNRIADRPELAARLRDAWASWQPALRREALPAGEERDLTQELKERLRSLGYVVK